jgi:hypothetical protein
VFEVKRLLELCLNAVRLFLEIIKKQSDGKSCRHAKGSSALHKERFLLLSSYD